MQLVIVEQGEHAGEVGLLFWSKPGYYRVILPGGRFSIPSIYARILKTGIIYQPGERKEKLINQTVVQLITAVRLFSLGAPLHIQGLGEQAKRMALEMGMIEQGKKYRYRELFVPHQDAPVWLLWELFRAVIDDGIGFSINKSAVWMELNIYPAGSRFETDRDMNYRMETLARLMHAGFIEWRAQGSVWEVRPNAS